MAIELTIDRRVRYTAFLLLALAINFVDRAIVRTVADPARRMVVSAAASVRSASLNSPEQLVHLNAGLFGYAL